MRSFLILKLQGPMQAWGGHTYEDYRPSSAFPSRSGLLGLMGACLGVDRSYSEGQLALSRCFRFAVRTDGVFGWLTDFHTVLNARKVGGRINDNPVVSRREYLVSAGDGAGFSVAVWQVDDGIYGLQDLAMAVRRPVYTPVLGRRSCPLARPLYEAEVNAEDAVSALSQIPPVGGPIYSEEGGEDLPQLRVRDEPIVIRPRQFASRRVFIHNVRSEGGGNVS